MTVSDEVIAQATTMARSTERRRKISAAVVAVVTVLVAVGVAFLRAKDNAPDWKIVGGGAAVGLALGMGVWFGTRPKPWRLNSDPHVREMPENWYIPFSAVEWTEGFPRPRGTYQRKNGSTVVVSRDSDGWGVKGKYAYAGSFSHNHNATPFIIAHEAGGIEDYQ
jgi:hypothetical protein